MTILEVLQKSERRDIVRAYIVADEATDDSAARDRLLEIMQPHLHPEDGNICGARLADILAGIALGLAIAERDKA